MSYLVFARKYRPLTFDDVVGQQHITATLKKAIEKDRVAHAYIFTGTRGVGKTTTARILARALNCDKGPTPTPCGVCEPCKNIIGGSSFDVLEIDGASNNSVEDIREIRDNVRYSSMGGKYRIYVIDEVHMLSKSAFNALLKTLEEPPASVIFIFATTEPQKIPATIHSRCQRFDFRRISTEQIAARLEQICTAEKIAFDRAALNVVARKAEGSMRDALSLLDQVFSFSHEKIDEGGVRSVLGIIGTEIYDTVMKAVAEKNAEPVLAAVEDILSRGFDLHEFVLGLEDHLRTLLFSRIPSVAGNPRIDLPADASGAIAKTASAFSEAALLRMAEIVRKTERDLRYSDFPRFLVELMLFKLVHLDNTVELEKLLASLGGPVPPAAAVLPSASVLTQDKKKSDVTPVAASPAPAKPAAAPPAAPADLQEDAPDDDEAQFDGEDVAPPPAPAASQGASGSLQVKWPEFLEHLKRDRPTLEYHISSAFVVSSTQTSIDIRFPKAFRFQFNEILKKKNRDDIQEKLNGFAGAPVELHITLEQAGDPPHPKSPVAPVKAPASISNEINNEPIIKNVLDIFDGSVL
jgi:DNA polymerase-3 subunit gamma/tau